MYRIIIFFSLIFAIQSVFADSEDTGERKPILSGYITDAENGEALIGATVYVKELGIGSVTNVYGFYSISLSPGKYTVKYTYIGFQPEEVEVTIKDKDVSKNIELLPVMQTIDEVVVTGEKDNANILRNEMSVEKLGSDDIRKIPALMGEVDVIKALQLLPGVQSPSEGSSGFSVRGGNLDQNLVLLDEANVYNASHLLGFFSVFNNDVVKDLTLYKGDIPARYGGRLSSVLDIYMREGNTKEFSGVGGLGIISSRLTLEGPLWKDKISFVAAGRRTYADLFLPLSKQEEVRNSTLYFYDLNLKINYRVNDNNRIFLSGYFGRDVFGSEFAKMGYGNGTATARWNHLFSKKLFSNLSLTYSNYYYSLGTPPGEANSFLWEAGLNDLALKYDFTYFATPDLTINYGIESMVHVFNPGHARGTGDNSAMGSIKVPTNRSIENGAYIGIEYDLSPLVSLKAGLRNATFANFGHETTYTYDLETNIIDSAEHGGGIYNHYMQWEPRMGLNVKLDEFTSVKASYARTTQFIQMARNSAAGTPLDVWFSASPNIKPQIGDQVAVGLFRNLFKNKLKASAEVYYKWMDNAIDFKDDAVLLLNKDLEGELRFGKATAYGAELMVKYQFEKINGWVSYTYSNTELEMEHLNEGKPYLAPYDKPHDVSVVFNYNVLDRLTIGATWVYSSGLPGTFPQGMADFMGTYIPIYSGRNEQRYPNYHRMDLALTWENKPKVSKRFNSRKFESSWNLSIYNVYNRHNTWAINFVQDENDPNQVYAEKTYLFGILPTVTYNFNF
ncbi:MAG: TonB-dependent receptor [Salinivirgaceae bacterium]